jgi:signal transduction histidine kinase/DNA-binding response OmpR family regulator/ligand-binding sensor domain-containing protein
MLLKSTYLAVLGCFFALLTHAQIQPINGQVFEGRHGITSTIRDFCQDEAGMLWFTTDGGLIRYDGMAFSLIRVSNKLDSVLDTQPIRSLYAITADDKNKLWILGRSELLFFDPETRSFAPLRQENGSPFVMEEDRLRQISLRAENEIWVSTHSTLYRLSLSTRSPADAPPVIAEVKEYNHEHGTFEALLIGELLTDSDGTLWVATNAGLARYDPTEDSFAFYQPETATEREDPVKIYYLTPAHSTENIWIQTLDGEIFRFNVRDKGFEKIIDLRDQPNLSYYLFLGPLIEDQLGRLWISFREEEALKMGWVYPDAKTFVPVSVVFQTTPGTIPLAAFRHIYEDLQGNIWMTGSNPGIIKYSPSPFSKLNGHQFITEPSNQPTNNVFDLLVDEEGYLWTISEQDLLTRQNLRTGDIQYYADSLHLLTGIQLRNYSGLTLDQGGNVWIWNGPNLYTFQKNTQTIIPVHPRHPVFTRAAAPGIRGFQIDGEGIWWFSTMGSIHRYDPRTGELAAPLSSNHPDLKKATMFSELFVDSHNKLWFGTGNNGFGRYDPVNDSIAHFGYSSGRKFAEHPDQTIYVGTYKDGLIRVAKNNLDINVIRRSDGLPANTISGGVLVDQDHQVWAGTSNGLASYDPQRDELKTYDIRDGLFSDYFTTDQPAMDSRNTIFFGTNNGVLQFSPDQIQIDSFSPNLVFDEFLYYDTDQRSRPERIISFDKPIKLGFQQNDFTISFAALHYKNPSQNTYAARLLPYQQGFRDLGTINEVSYNNLDPGRYTLQVKAANSDGVWNEEGISLDIFIRPPWYWNPWSKLVYFLLVAGVIYGLYRFQLNRRLAFAEANRLRELDEVKTNLYTNITHEFRTPLTVIKGITEQIQGHDTEKKLIERNSDQVLGLVQQMLDLAKVDAGQASVSMVHGDILYFLRYVVESFHSLAFQQKVSLHFYAEEEELHMDYDPEKIMGILSNLISNAIKFTPEYGKIQVVARRISDPDGEQNVLELLIKDTGVGIDQVHLPFLFDRFYQVDASRTRRGEGTGIGLSLTKEWVELMDGQITVESEVDRGTTFLVKLPITHDAEDADSALIVPLRLKQSHHAGRQAALRPPNWLGTIAERPLLLIVEDNLDVQHYLTLCLESEYRLVFARNGGEGLDRAHQYIPDLIISDVMMPEMDGFELCHQLKTDHRTSHIPIIMLTARASAQDRITGLQKGADAYLAKPFSREELHVRLEKLIELRHRLREKYSQGFLLPDPDSISEDTEMAFLQKLHQTVRSNLEREDFKLDQLARELAMSRMQLHRKLKALTDQTPAQYVKQIRMAYAKKLLLETTLSVSEVATKVGFRSHAHFSTAFKDFFGTAPSKV